MKTPSPVRRKAGTLLAGGFSLPREKGEIVQRGTMASPDDLAAGILRKLEEAAIERHVEESRSFLKEYAAYAKIDSIDASSKELRNRRAALPEDHPLMPEIDAGMAQLAAKRAFIAKDLASPQPSRKDLMNAVRACGATRKDLANVAWPIHPKQALERLKMWTRGARYPDGSDGDIAVRTAMRSFLK